MLYSSCGRKNRRDIRGRHNWMVLRGIWKVLVCPQKMPRLIIGRGRKLMRCWITQVHLDNVCYTNLCYCTWWWEDGKYCSLLVLTFATVVLMAICQVYLDNHLPFNQFWLEFFLHPGWHNWWLCNCISALDANFSLLITNSICLFEYVLS